MNDRHAPEPRVVTCRGTADFLAALPELAGFTASDSLFIVLFSGKRTGPALRVDLPASEEPRQAAEFLDFVSRAIRRLGAVTGASSAPAIVVSSSVGFAESGGPPWRRLARRLERRLERDGVRPRELCCIAPDGWISYLDPAAPRGGRPLREIAESPVALEARVRGAAVPELGDLGGVPEPDPARAAAVATALGNWPPIDPPDAERVPPPRSASGLPPRQSSSPGARDPEARDREAWDRRARGPEGRDPEARDPEHAWIPETAEVCRALMSDGDGLSPEMTARLIRRAAHPPSWLFLVLGLMMRPEFPGELAREMGPAGFAGIAIDLDADPTAPPVPGWSIRRLLRGICPEFDEHGRLLKLRAALAARIAETPEPLRPGMFALSAWVWWICGSQTASARQVEMALEIDPEHELALMVGRLTATPVFTRWIVEDSAEAVRHAA